jgi:hypothetical protein
MQKYSVNQQFIETVLASVKAGEIAIPEIQRPFMWDGSKVRDLISQRGDIHNPFPRDYLKKKGLDRRSKYNQIANYVYMQSEINIKIGNRSPKEYFGLITGQINNANPIISGISTEAELRENLRMNCVPEEIVGMEMGDYQELLGMKRTLMVEKIRRYYERL